MNPGKTFASDSGAHSNLAALASLDETLRLIAKLPAPAGLEDRVLTGVRAGVRAGMLAGSKAESHFGRLLVWPASFSPQRDLMQGAMRAAAAAAIVCVVLGGGWGIHARFQSAPLPTAITQPQVNPARQAAPGGFSSAGAMHTPVTLNGPLVAQPTITKPQAARPDENKTTTKSSISPSGPVHKKPNHNPPAVAGKTAARPATAPMK